MAQAAETESTERVCKCFLIWISDKQIEFSVLALHNPIIPIITTNGFHLGRTDEIFEF